MRFGRWVRLRSGRETMLIVDVLRDGDVVWRDSDGVHEWTLPTIVLEEA